MKERPILFSGAMVRAILDGRKTQTRRVCKARGVDFIGSGGRSGADWNDPDCWGYEAGDGEWYVLSRSPSNGMRSIVCPYGQPGDRLWVRETWNLIEAVFGGTTRPVYRASPETYTQYPGIAWRPSIFMPRWASRITLEVVGVRVERVQDIDDADAYAEGMEPLADEWVHSGASARDLFLMLWNEINAKRGYSWDSNPWVWVVEFKRI